MDKMPEPCMSDEALQEYFACNTNAREINEHYKQFGDGDNNGIIRSLFKDIDSGLTEQEKLMCSAMWLNALYRSYLTCEPITDSFPEEEPDGVDTVRKHRDAVLNYWPCRMCPKTVRNRCSVSTRDIAGEQNNFTVLEKFVGNDSML